jgi:hypothetical protein
MNMAETQVFAARWLPKMNLPRNLGQEMVRSRRLTAIQIATEGEAIPMRFQIEGGKS